MGHQLATEMTFKAGRAVFFAKARLGVCYPLGAEKKHVIDGEVVGGGGGPAYFQDHIWSTELPEYAAGMVKQAHFMDPEGYILDPGCLPAEALQVWPTLNRKQKQLLCLHLIDGKDAAEAVGLIPQRAQRPEAAPETEDVPEVFECPVPGCGVTADTSKGVEEARAALLIHQRLLHPNWGS